MPDESTGERPPLLARRGDRSPVRRGRKRPLTLAKDVGALRRLERRAPHPCGTDNPEGTP